MDSDICSQHLSPKRGEGMREEVAQWLEEGGREEALDQLCTHPLTLPLETLPGGVVDLLVPNTSQFHFFCGGGV